jgi:uncharacterized OB-fold protein
MEGWKCPVCGRGLSPYVTVCPCDGQGQRYEYGSTTNPLVACQHDWDYSVTSTASMARCRKCGAYKPVESSSGSYIVSEANDV